MEAKATTTEIRRELQQLLSTEHELVCQVESMTASGEYLRLRDLANRLIEVAENRVQLRVSLAEANARDKVERGQAAEPHRLADQAAETWRQLR